MKPRFFKRMLTLLCIALLLSIIVHGYMRMSEQKKARAELDKMNQQFYSAVLNSESQSDEIEIADLIPAEWDKMYLFGAYTTREEKFAAAGCEYNLAISSGVSESLISMLFMNGNEVAYYVEFYPWQSEMPYSVRLVIGTEFDRASFTPSDRPRLVRSFGSFPTDRQSADQVVHFTLTAGN